MASSSETHKAKDKSTRLTALAGCGGCAAKVDPALLEILRCDLIGTEFGETILAGLNPADDAAVIELDSQRALIASVDFFPPLVDDPSDYGHIAANNAISDIYAMGGRLTLALAICGFPRSVDSKVVAAVNRAAAITVKEHGGFLLGGHSIYCAEPIFGLCVIGEAPPDKLWLKSAARDGDSLVLSKPLGTGVMLSSRLPQHIATATEAMKVSNRKAANSLAELSCPPGAVTDITGFGLIGHAHEISQQSQLGLQIDLDRVPLLAGSLTAVSSGVRTQASDSNAAIPHTVAAELAGDPRLPLLSDPQTAGGLLASVSTDSANILKNRGFSIIGRIDSQFSGIAIT